MKTKDLPPLPPDYHYGRAKGELTEYPDALVIYKNRTDGKDDGTNSVATITTGRVRMAPPNSMVWTTFINDLTFEEGLRVAAARVWLGEY